MKVSEVAKRLQVTEETVRNWLRSERIKGTRIGGKRAGWRIPISEVERLEKGEVPLKGLTALGADLVLKRLEQKKRKDQ